MTGYLDTKCAWCEVEERFTGNDPEEDWRQSGWLTHIDDDGERDYCSIDCAISALSP